MEKDKKKVPNHCDLSQLIENVPAEHRDYVKDLCLRMLQHPAYGQHYEWSTRDFEMGVSLGRGKFGRVYLSRERSTQYMVAMKVMFKAEIQVANVQHQLLREIEIQSRLKHPHILRLLTWFHDTDRIYLALELASHGDLYKILREAPNKRFDEPRAAKYMYQVADALHYCHLNNVIHRDLKPENILLTAADDVKLADFGWSVHSLSKRRKTLCGSLDYLPPEIVDGHSYDDSVDQWSLGILCYEFCTGRPPFESAGSNMTYEKIRRLQVHYPSYMSAGAKDVIVNLLRKSGGSRITLIEVMQNLWVKTNKEIRNKQLAEMDKIQQSKN